MAKDASSVQVHGESLLQFPGIALILYQYWLPDGIPEAFDSAEIFERLIGSKAYQHQRWNHSYKGEHGPFAVSEIRPDHYECIAAEELGKALRERVIPASQAKLDRYLDSWPSTEMLQQRLKALLSYIQSSQLRWYRLAIGLQDEQYWSDGYREVPILDHFEEWVGLDPEAAMVHMLQVIRD